MEVEDDSDTQCVIDGEVVNLPFKKPGCSHQHDAELRCAPVLLVSYTCDECGTSWEQQWSCACEDECPNCGDDVEAEDWHAIALCSCAHGLK